MPYPLAAIRGKTFRSAKPSGAIDIDHETNDLSQYTSTSGADISAAAGAALNGTNYGLNILFDDVTVDWGQKTITTSTTNVLRVRFYLDMNSLSMANNDAFWLMHVTKASASSVGGVRITYITSGSKYYLEGFLIDDGGGPRAHTAFLLTDAPHCIEYYLLRSADAGSNGYMECWVDGASIGSVANRINYTKFSDFSYIRIGKTYISVGCTTVTGTFYMDELIVNTTGELIGA